MKERKNILNIFDHFTFATIDVYLILDNEKRHTSL